MSKAKSRMERLPISGLGPHGERAVSFQHVSLSESEAKKACDSRFSVSVVLHTTTSDWARQQLAGIVSTLGKYSAVVTDVIDCHFHSDHQNEALKRLVENGTDAIISIPIGNAVVSHAHHLVSRAGIVLVMLDNVPTGLISGVHYASLVSADNFGLGQTTAELLAAHISEGGVIGMITHGIDFFVTNEREIAFRKWMATHRPDIAIKQAKFREVHQAGAATDALLDAVPDLAGLFVIWDEPAIAALQVLRNRERRLPVTTIDLGNTVALELASGGLIKGIGAQQPYEQGRAAATAALLSLVGRPPPPWIALPGLEVTEQNVLESYQVVWHMPVLPELAKARRAQRVTVTGNQTSSKGMNREH